MRVVETDWWTLELPEEWQAEQEDELVVIEDEDGVSCIEISTLVRERGQVGDAELEDFSRELREEGRTARPARVGEWQGLLFEYDDDEFHWREWYLRAGAHFLFIAYHCLPEHAGMDDAAVDEILSTVTRREDVG